MMLWAAILLLPAMSGCGTAPKPPTPDPLLGWSNTAMSRWDMSAPQRAAPEVQLSAAGNEWTSFCVEITGLPPGAQRASLALRVAPIANRDGPLPLEAADVAVYQVMDLPVDVNRASAVRHAGQVASSPILPRALVPLKAENGQIPLTALRPPVTPGSAGSAAPGLPEETSARIWVDLHLPKQAPAGQYSTACQLLASTFDEKGEVKWLPLSFVPVDLTVRNFSLPDQRSVRMVGQVTWESLVKHFGPDFETITPHLVSRVDRKYEGTVRTLDALQSLSQRHRLSVVFPRLQPSVKWPQLLNNPAPDIYWRDFDELIAPWLKGSVFPDKVGVGFWPLPEPDRLRTYDARSRLAYWSLAASHFDQREWLSQSAAILAGRPRGAEAIELSVEAAQLLAAHPRLAVSVPLEEGQVQIDDPAAVNAIGGRLIDPLHASRLRVAAARLIDSRQTWPAKVDEPQRWLRADLPSLVEVGSGGAEQDVRLQAWLAFLRQSQQIMFGHTLPADALASAAADPSELVWFYPGHWFGLEEPVPSVHLKWLRQAEQDFEYLNLAKLRGETINAVLMARLLTKPVEIGREQFPDAAYAMMTGTADPQAWANARDLLGRFIELYALGAPGANRPAGTADPVAKEAAEIALLQWARPQERPLLIGRTTEWKLASPKAGAQWVDLHLGLDIYNAADVAPGNNQLRWTAMNLGWEVTPQPSKVPPLSPYRVLRTQLNASFNLNKTAAGTKDPLSLELSIDSPSAKFISPLSASLPVVGCDRREGRFSLDGKLDDWTDVDLIHDGPLVKMLSRPAVLAQALEKASTNSRLYTNYANDNFYVAFALEGVTATKAQESSARNFVEYQLGRAWGENLCELLLQPIYADNTLGPTLHIVCKPNGSSWIERKLNPLLNVNPWAPYEGTGTRYAATLTGEKWTGEVAIPWQVLRHPAKGLPTLVRFNFSQHRSGTGESASWAGPVDFGRDDDLTGLIHVKLPLAGNPGEAVEGNPPGNGSIER